MIGNGFERFGQFALLFGCLLKVFVLRTPVACLKGLGNSVGGRVLPVLHEGGGIVGIPGQFSSFLVQNVLHVRLLPESGVE